MSRYFFQYRTDRFQWFTHINNSQLFLSYLFKFIQIKNINTTRDLFIHKYYIFYDRDRIDTKKNQNQSLVWDIINGATCVYLRTIIIILLGTKVCYSSLIHNHINRTRALCNLLFFVVLTRIFFVPTRLWSGAPFANFFWLPNRVVLFIYFL